MTDQEAQPQPGTGAAPARPRRRWVWRLTAGMAATFVLVVTAGFLVAPSVVRSVGQRRLSELLGRKVTIGHVRVNPLALAVAVEDVAVFEADGATPFVGFRRFFVNASLSSVLHGAPVIEEVSLESLRVHVVHTKATADGLADVDAAYNFSDILARLAAAPKAPEPPPRDGPPPKFSLNNLRVADAAVVFDDRPTGDHHELTELSVSVPFVSTLPVYVDAFVVPGLSVSIDGRMFAMQGRTKPFKSSLETVLEVRLQDLDLSRYVPFVPLKLPFAVRSARLSLALDVGFSRAADDAPRLTVKGTVGLGELDVEEKHKAGPRALLAVKKLDVVIGESDLSAARYHLEKVVLAGLSVHARRERDGSLNLEHMVPGAPRPVEARAHHAARAAASSEPKPPDEDRRSEKRARREEKEGPRFTLDHFALENATIHLVDETVEPKTDLTVRDLSVTVRGLSNAPGATAHESVRLRVPPDLSFTQQGTVRLAPLEAKGKLKVEGIEPARFAPYFRDRIAFDLQSGKLGLGGDYLFEETRGRQTIRLSDAFLDVADLALRRKGAGSDFFQLGGLSVRGADVDLAERTVKVAQISTHDGRVRAARDARGVVDLAALLAPPPARPVASAPAPAPEPAEPGPPPPPWTVTLARFDLDGWATRFDDRAVTPAAALTLDPIALHLTNVSTAPGAKVGLDLRVGVNKTGKLQVTGSSTLPPVAANLHFDLRALDILPLQPYFRDQVSLTVTSGNVSLKGQASVKTGNAGAPPEVTVTTDIDLADVATVDRDRQEALLKWGSFHVGGLHVTTPPTAVAIDEVALSDFASRLILFPDAHFNLQDALAPPGAPRSAAAPPPRAKAGGPARAPVAQATAPGPDGPAMPLSIGRITLQGGQIAFRDRLIHPSYSADLTDLAGRVSNLSSRPDSTADIDLRGSVNRSGVLTIVGKANPLAKELTLEVAVNLRDFELPPTSPYTAKYAGYDISKGKLDLSLAYKIAHGKLDAQNELVLDQFTFGDKVDSPSAVKLPLRLAVALLKDRHGVIDINLPIAGSLSDPEFRIWPAVWKVLGNLVLKAVTEPFAMLASAFGAGDDVSKIAFPAGLATLDAAAQKRLGVVAKVLRERPGVSFEICGQSDAAQEREALRRYLFERKLKARRISELVQAGAQVPASLDDLSVSPADRPRLLAAAYKAETFPKPTNAFGLPKSLPPEEMEKLMLVNTSVDEAALRALAQRRAAAVQASLAGAAVGAAGRLFLVAPRLAGSGGLVELTLKKD